MKITTVFTLLVCLAHPAATVTVASASPGTGVIQHYLGIAIDPVSHTLSVIDRVILPDDLHGAAVCFLLHPDLTITGHSAQITLNRETAAGPVANDTAFADFIAHSPEIEPAVYTLQPTAPGGVIRRFELRYSGRIFHPIKSRNPAYARSFSTTPGIIAPEGVFLASSSQWLPWFGRRLSVFDMVVDLPAGWQSISQGDRVFISKERGRAQSRWRSSSPGDEVFLVAAQWHEFARSHGRVRLMAMLRTPDGDLAERYLSATGSYLSMYEELLGRYPYKKFALVENFWETGYGMPSFTLLGPRVIRFPFILHSSYPHELLHNWWGNGVFVAYEEGNWCEGITAYMADHLIKEQMQQGKEYRRSTLQAYRDYVADNADFPIRDFRSRHDAASAAIGYGKAMMVYHMLRGMLGDETFLAAWRDFYHSNQFARVSFRQIKRSFEKASGQDLSAFFNQWIDTPGAPELSVEPGKIENINSRYRIRFTIKQNQAGPAYSLQIPIALQRVGNNQAEQFIIPMTQKSQSVELTSATPPLVLQVDPGFDLFRRLHPLEIPPALSQAFGSERVLIILPENDSVSLKQQYRRIAGRWAGDRKGVFTIATDLEIKDLPADHAVWVMGRRNRWRHLFYHPAESIPCVFDARTLKIGETTVDEDISSVLLAIRHPDNPSAVVIYLSVHDASTAPSLLRKLPHYGKYSYLTFGGSNATNKLKGQWPTTRSPLMIRFPDQPSGTASLRLPPEKPLIERERFFSPER